MSGFDTENGFGEPEQAEPPPAPPSAQPAPPPYPYGSGYGHAPRSGLPVNAELLVYVAALAVAAVFAWLSDPLDAASWFDFFKWTTVGYLLARGIAKASRVLGD